jgi:hypothetical protein
LFGVALLFLYLLGVRGWQLVPSTILVGFGMAIVLAGPLDRIIPPPLEPYQPPAWKKEKLVTLFRRDPGESDEPKI